MMTTSGILPVEHRHKNPAESSDIAILIGVGALLAAMCFALFSALPVDPESLANGTTAWAFVL